MNATDYQRQSQRTLMSDSLHISPHDTLVVYCAIGLAGEASEILEYLKKTVFHHHEQDDSKLRKEIGDVCWYVAALCSTLGFDLSDVMTENIEKLRVRYPDGFKPEDSVKRVDVDG